MKDPYLFIALMILLIIFGGYFVYICAKYTPNELPPTQEQKRRELIIGSYLYIANKARFMAASKTRQGKLEAAQALNDFAEDIEMGSRGGEL